MQIHAWEQPLISLAHEALHNPSLDLHEPKSLFDETALIDRAYDYCERLTANHSKSFFLASALLPADKRRAVRALYAFCRISDDIIDQNSDYSETNLKTWRQRILTSHPNRNDPVALAWADTRLRYQIPLRYAEQLIDGVARDLQQHRYSTFAELTTYAYGVASTVGLMSMHIIGFSGREAIPYAIKLGVALQLTNILRDVAEDWQAGRIYLPLAELAAFDLTEADLALGQVDDRWRKFMCFQIERNRRLYAEAWPGIALLDPHGRLAIAAAAKLYEGILDDIERHDYDVFNRRAYVSKWAKLTMLPGIWWQSNHIQFRGNY
ncbi:MAG: squalene/phytoene synthase family protein [Anaerolineae bacterium]|nr:squalene/phytoene synthase family protein [Anaerolineae bacterium]